MSKSDRFIFSKHSIYLLLKLKRGVFMDQVRDANVYDDAQKLVYQFEKKYPFIAMRLNKDQLLTAAVMSIFTKKDEKS